MSQLEADGSPRDPLILKDGRGRTAVLTKSPEVLEDWQGRFQRKGGQYQDLKLETWERSYEHPDPASLTMRRLAAKIAFEFLAMRRPAVAAGEECRSVRRFIIAGEESTVSLASPIVDRRIIEKLFPSGGFAHCCWIIGLARPKETWAILSLFGLQFYSVCLTESHPVLGDFEECVLMNPQDGSVSYPWLRGGGSHAPDLRTIHLFRFDGDELHEAACTLADELLREGFKAGRIRDVDEDSSGAEPRTPLRSPSP